MALLLDLTPLRSAPAYRRLWLGLSVSNMSASLSRTARTADQYSSLITSSFPMVAPDINPNLGLLSP